MLVQAAQPIVTFFMTISIGAKTDVKTILKAGASGIVLGLISAATAVLFFFIINLLLPKKERNAMGAAIGTTALNSAMTPAAVGRGRSDSGSDSVESGNSTVCNSFYYHTVPDVRSSLRAFDKMYAEETERYLQSPEGWAYEKVAH